jgi:hypothetical protein
MLQDIQIADFRDFFTASTAYPNAPTSLEFEKAIRQLARDLINGIEKAPPFDPDWPSLIPSWALLLLEATRELKSRLEELWRVYRKEWKAFDPGSLSGDFRELLMLNRQEIRSFQECDPNAPRKDESAVQALRTRMSHELTYATSSLYKTAKYLGVAESVLRDLKEGVLNDTFARYAREEMIRLILDVRIALQGSAGIFAEQQESIGETVLGSAGRVITYSDFKEKLLKVPGWEQFTGLFRFFVDFELKVEYEVKGSLLALSELERKVNQLHELRTANPVYRA